MRFTNVQLTKNIHAYEIDYSILLFSVFVTNLNENMTTSNHLTKIRNILEKYGGASEIEIFDKQCLKLSMNDWVETNIHLNQCDEGLIVKMLSENANNPGKVFSSPGLLEMDFEVEESEETMRNSSSLFAVIILNFGPSRFNCVKNLSKEFGDNNVSTVS